jgi:hypothetical protein
MFTYSLIPKMQVRPCTFNILHTVITYSRSCTCFCNINLWICSLSFFGPLKRFCTVFSFFFGLCSFVPCVIIRLPLILSRLSLSSCGFRSYISPFVTGGTMWRCKKGGWI